MIFKDAGKQHTDETLRIAREAALERCIRFIVVATTTGETGAAAARLLAGDDAVQLIAVTHNAGFSKPNEPELLPEHRDAIEENGGIVYTGTIPTRGVGTAIRNKFQGYSAEQIVASTLRIFGQGAKVCVEMAAMVSDAGLVPAEDIITVAGTGRGADTAAIVTARPTNFFFDIKLKEFLARPGNW